MAFHWSGGKDSALALSVLLAENDVVVERLVTTVHPARAASTVHGLPVALLQDQAASIGIPLQTVPLRGVGLDGYTEAMNAAAVQLRREGIDAFAFGDLGASGVLEQKQAQFGPLGIEVLEPLWGLSSRECIERFLGSGLRAVTVVVDAAVLGRDRVGVPLDRDFVDRLPSTADPVRGVRGVPLLRVRRAAVPEPGPVHARPGALAGARDRDERGPAPVRLLARHAAGPGLTRGAPRLPPTRGRVTGPGEPVCVAEEAPPNGPSEPGDPSWSGRGPPTGPSRARTSRPRSRRPGVGGPIVGETRPRPWPAADRPRGSPLPTRR